MLVTCASASAVVRSSGIGGRAVLIVNGIRMSFCVQLPTDRYAVARLRAGRLTEPETFTAFRLLSGQSDMRPWDGPDVGESVMRSGLSQISGSTLFRKNDPS